MYVTISSRFGAILPSSPLPPAGGADVAAVSAAVADVLWLLLLCLPV